jgi:hypothetical protein
MKSQPEENWQRRLQDLEAEIKSTSVNTPKPEAQTPVSRFAQWNLYLSTIKKVAVTGVVMLLTVWMVQTVFALVASIISLAVLAVLVYLGYKFFIANRKIQ